jgi:hypothetical protein
LPVGRAPAIVSLGWHGKLDEGNAEEGKEEVMVAEILLSDLRLTALLAMALLLVLKKGMKFGKETRFASSSLF